MKASTKELTRLLPRISFHTDPSKCWEWKGYILPNGYGSMAWRGQSEKAHRIVYSLCVDPDISGFDLHHMCENKRCVNFHHLLKTTRKHHPGTAMDTKRNKTHCPAGHPYDESNTYFKKTKRGTSRECKKCHAVKEKSRYHSRRAEEINK